MSVEIVSSCVN